MKKDSGTSAVLWWIGWITLTIIAFFVCAYVWTGVIARHVGPMSQKGVPILWVSTVFGSWMVLLVPLIVIMYNKVDKAYEDARMNRETTAFQKAKKAMGIRSLDIEPELRKLDKSIAAQLKGVPDTIPKGHLVHATLKDGRVIQNVFIYNKKEILGIYDANRMDFNANDVSRLYPIAAQALPNFETEKWLRLDGV